MASPPFHYTEEINMKTNAPGTKLKTPALSKMFEDEYITRLKHDEKTLGDNWENFEDETCPKCNGTGINPEHPEDGFCIACEGTGIWYRLVYGMSGGEPYAYTWEWGIDFVKEAAKNYRMAHTEMQMAGKTYTHMRPYLLPKTLEMELEARGLDARTKDQDMKKYIMGIVAREYPDFMCVNYTNF